MADPITRPLKAYLEHSEYEIKPSLTFGVEIEFLLASAKEVRLEPEWDDSDEKTYEPDPNPEDSRKINQLNLTPGKDLAENVRHHIAATMGNAGIITEVGKSTDLKWSPTDKSAWVVNTDQTLKASDEKYDYYQIEIQSPPYYFSDTALQTVKYVCALLSNTYRISVNPSCGLHVHVGNSNTGFSTSTIQNFLATVWTFEPQLDSIHPYHRSTNITQCPSLQGHSNIVELARKWHGSDMIAYGGQVILCEGTKRVPVEGSRFEEKDVVCDLADYVEWAAPVEKKGNESGTTRKGRYWIGGLLEESKRKTMEFREHEATLDPERVANWITVCVGLLEFADTIPLDDLNRFLSGSMARHETEQPKLQDVLRALELPQQADIYEKCVEDVKKHGEKHEPKKLYDIRDYGSV